MQLFKDSRFQKELNLNGFIKIPFFSAEEVLLIRQKYEDIWAEQHASVKLFHTTYETCNSHLIANVADFLEQLYLPKINRLFNDVLPVGATFLVKDPGAKSESPFHQDASLVDEPANMTISVWVALEDSNEQNGCIQFVPKSHHLFARTRYMPYTNTHLEPYNNLLRENLTHHTVKAGETFVFYNALVHYSPPNLTDKRRLACSMTLYPANTQLSLFVKNGDRIERYAVSTEEIKNINGEYNPDKEKLMSSCNMKPQPTKEEVYSFFVKKMIF